MQQIARPYTTMMFFLFLLCLTTFGIHVSIQLETAY